MYNIFLDNHIIETRWKKLEQAQLVALSEVACRALCGQVVCGALEIRNEDGQVIASFDPKLADWHIH